MTERLPIQETTQRFKATFRVDLESREETDGQEARIMSLCGKRGAEWSLSWEVQEDGELWVGIVWKRTASGAVKEWTSSEFEVNCDAISGEPLGHFSLDPASEKLPSEDGDCGWGITLPSWQGKGHGLQDLVLSLEMVSPRGVPSEPNVNSISIGYTDYSVAPSSNNVKFSFPENLSLYANVESLSKASYFRALFNSGFAEGSPSTPEQGPAKSNQRKVEREFDDSDDETDDQIVSKLSPTASNNTDTPADAHEPSIDPLPKIDSQYRLVQIDAAAYTTYHAVLCYIQTGHITFAPLRSSFRLQVDPTGLRNAKIRQLQSAPSHPLAASPKSIYRLAHFLELATLAKLALDNLKSQLTKENIAFEVFGDLAAVYDEVGNMELEYAAENEDAMGASAAMGEVGKLVDSGDLPSFSVMSFKLMRARAQKKAVW